MPAYEIIRYAPSDAALKDEVVELRRHSYENELHESREFLEWKYERNPYIPEPIFYLARAEGRVVGMRGMYGTCWETGGGRTVIPCADDFAVTPAHRNTGVMTLIMRFALDDMARRGYAYVMNNAGGRVTVLSSLAAGWKSIGMMEPVVRRERGEALRHAARERIRATHGLWRLVRRTDALIRSPDGPWRRLDMMGRTAARDGISITAGRTPRAAEMAALHDRLPGDGRIRHVRDAAFFAWRYANPTREHRFLFAEQAGRLEGYLALARWRQCRLPNLPFHIVDWVGSSREAREELVRWALRVARFPEIGMWFATRSREERAFLEGEGFEPTDLEFRERGLPCILLKKLGPPAPPEQWTLGGGSALDLARWDIRLIDSMHG